MRRNRYCLCELLVSSPRTSLYFLFNAGTEKTAQLLKPPNQGHVHVLAILSAALNHSSMCAPWGPESKSLGTAFSHSELGQGQDLERQRYGGEGDLSRRGVACTERAAKLTTSPIVRLPVNVAFAVLSPHLAVL